MKSFICDECEGKISENNMAIITSTYSENEYHGAGKQEHHYCDFLCLYAGIMKDSDKYGWGETILTDWFKDRYK